MKINKKGILINAIIFGVLGIVSMLGPKPNQGAFDMSTFNMQISLVLFAIWNCTENE